MACVHDDNGRVRIQHFYNVGQWAKEVQRNPARDEEGVFENNRVTCRFKRPVNVPRDETIVDLHLSWYYLFAWGPAIQGKPQFSLCLDRQSPPCACALLVASHCRGTSVTALGLLYREKRIGVLSSEGSKDLTVRGPPDTVHTRTARACETK